MCGTSFIAAPAAVGIDSLVVLGCRVDGWDATACVTALAMSGNGPLFWPVEFMDDATLMSAVQSFLAAKKARLPASENLKPVWRCFYRRYHRVVRNSIAASACRTVSVAERDDFRQEVWHEILLRLPKLKHAHIQKGISPWLAGLTRRKVRRLMQGSSSTHRSECHVSLEDLKECLPSRDMGPEEACCFRETWGQLDLALAKLRERTSPENCDLFFRRFFWRQSAKEIGASLDLTPKAVRQRYGRLKRLWRRLTVDLALPGCGDVVGLVADFPTSGDNF